MFATLFGRLLCAVGKHRFERPPAGSRFRSGVRVCARCGKLQSLGLPLENPPPPPIQPWQREMWKEQERARHMRAEDLVKTGVASGAILIRVNRSNNFKSSEPSTPVIVIRLGEGIGGPWQAGDLIAFWPDGEHTALDGLEFEIVNDDLFNADRGGR